MESLRLVYGDEFGRSASIHDQSSLSEISYSKAVVVVQNSRMAQRTGGGRKLEVIVMLRHMPSRDKHRT